MQALHVFFVNLSNGELEDSEICQVESNVETNITVGLTKIVSSMLWVFTNRNLAASFVRLKYPNLS